MERTYKLTISVDYLDSNPEIKYFTEWYELQDFIEETVEIATQYRVAHSPYKITTEELHKIEEQELSLMHVEEIQGLT